jgi:hypothetical protein
LNQSNEPKEDSRELETIKQTEREHQRACNDQPKPKRAAESLNQSNETKKDSRELETIN